MFSKQSNLALAGTLFLLSVPAFSQEEGVYRNEFSAQAFGSFLKTTTDNGVQQSASNSGGVLGNYRFFFNRNNGVEVDYGYALNTQRFGLANGSLGINTRAHEASAAYVFRYPLKHWTPFALAGAGGLIFDPKDAAGVSSC